MNWGVEPPTPDNSNTGYTYRFSHRPSAVRPLLESGWTSGWFDWLTSSGLWLFIVLAAMAT